MNKYLFLIVAMASPALSQPARAEPVTGARELVANERDAVGLSILDTISANINNIRCNGITVGADLSAGDVFVLKGHLLLLNSQDIHYPVARSETSLFVNEQTHNITALTSANQTSYLPYTGIPVEGNELYRATYTISDDGLYLKSMQFKRSQFIRKNPSDSALTEIETGSAECSDIDYAPIAE